MKNLSSAGFLICGLAIGIFAGRSSMSSETAPRKNSDPAPAPRVVKRDRPGNADSGQTSISKIRQSSPTELAALTQKAVTIPDPVEMRRHLTECLLNMTADNWREVVAGFAKLSAESGRDAADEWKLALFRSGQLAGGSAMDVYLAAGLKEKSQESWHVLYGWSTKDPRAALEWLKNAEATGHATPNDIYAAIVAGAALGNPRNGLSLLDEIPADRRSACAGHLVWNVLQNGGTEALDQVLQYASTLDPADPNNKGLASNLFSEVTEKLLWKADHARDVGQACEVVTKLIQYGQDPDSTTRQALQKYRWYDMPAKLNILETASTAPQPGELDLAALSSTVLNTMNGDNDRAAVREWMSQHPGSPLIPHLEKRVSGTP